MTMTRIGCLLRLETAFYRCVERAGPKSTRLSLRYGQVVMATDPAAGVLALPYEPDMPAEVAPRRLARRALQAVGLLAVLIAVAVLAPGLGEVRRRLAHADVGWVGLAVVLEALSCCSYVLLFRPVFCSHMSWRTSSEISWSELAMGSIVPASGAGGLALGAWILRRGGMPAEQIARRSVAFFLLKSSVNFIAVAVIGALMAVGVLGPHQPLWRTALPAALALVVIVAVASLGRLGVPADEEHGTRRGTRARAAARRALVTGVREGLAIARAGELPVIAGAFGYWAFDNAVLWATYHAVGASVPIAVVLMGYLIGQLGGALPLPGGIGGIDLGLIGTLIVYGAPASATAAAVLAYRVILFWLPLVVGAVAFWSLQRALRGLSRADLCEPAVAA
jgi:uncharacterized membrane protein YbhN (UPF0104 family)